MRSDNYSGQNPTDKEPFIEIDRTSGKLSTNSLSRFGTLPNTAAAGTRVNENHPAHADEYSACRRLCCKSSISFASPIEVVGSDAAPDGRRHSSSFFSEPLDYRDHLPPKYIPEVPARGCCHRGARSQRPRRVSCSSGSRSVDTSLPKSPGWRQIESAHWFLLQRPRAPTRHSSPSESPQRRSSPATPSKD